MPSMGRKPTVNLNLPPRMRARKQRSGETYYYYDAGGKPRREIPLGKVYTEAVRQWADLEHADQHITSALITFKQVADRYQREIIPTKAIRTQDDNIKELQNLLAFFNDPPAPLDEIKPLHVRQYLDHRTEHGKHSTVRANRERALLSHIWNKAREWGLTDKENPCRGVTGYTETGRDIYIEDSIYRAVYEHADQTLKDALDLAYLTGQRPADVLAMSKLDIKDGKLQVGQGKTGKRLRITIEGQLAQLITRTDEQKKTMRIHSLAIVCTATGRPLTYEGLKNRFQKARTAAAKANPKLKAEIEAFQFRDLRAKAGTDKADTGDMRQAQMQLGHGSIKMTEHYVRQRRGDVVTPTK